MGNMSYCRFENTRVDLADCIEAVNDRDALSSSEARAMRGMLQEFCDLLVDEGIVVEYDEECIDRLVTQMTEQGEEGSDEF